MKKIKLSIKLFTCFIILFCSIVNSSKIYSNINVSSQSIISNNNEKDATIDNLKNKLDIANKKIYDLESQLNEAFKKQDKHSQGVTYNINPSDNKDSIIDYLRMKLAQANAKIRDLENQLTYALKNARNNNTNVPSQNHNGSSDNQKDYATIDDNRESSNSISNDNNTSFKKDLLLVGALMEDNEMKDAVYIDIELTNIQPHPESFTLPGEYFLKVKILDFKNTKIFYYNVFFNESSFTLMNDPLGEFVELYQGKNGKNNISIIRAKAGHFIVITTENGNNPKYFVFPKDSGAAEEFMPFLKDAILKSGIREFIY